MARKRSRLSSLRRRLTRSDAFVSFLAATASVVLRCYGATLRIERSAHPEVDALDPAKVLYAFWHGRQLLLVPSFRHRGIAIMTDLSWAGRIQAGILTRLGYPVVRGSSRRQAARALAAMKRAIEGGHSAAFAVDGPGGPVRRSKPGIIFLAEKLGYPIVPVATSARRALVLGSTWCRYLVPAPFSRGLVLMGPPIREAADGTLKQQGLDTILDELTAEADRRVGREPDSSDVSE